MSRTGLSRPMQQALEDGVVDPQQTVFDFGCGRGGDVQRLRALGLEAQGWDPAHRPNAPRVPADVVNIGYVVNVIEDRRERVQALQDAWTLAKRAMVVAARPDWELRDLTSAQPRSDGWITTTGTFQKFFAQDELRAWIDATLETQSVAAAPGVFYVFRDDRDAQSFRARQVRRVAAPRQRMSEVLFEAHRDLLEELAEFMETRGRLPVATELEGGDRILAEFGSIKAAFLVVRRVTGDDRWDIARSAGEQNLLVYLALSAFGGRRKMSELPEDLQRDIRSMFGSYRAAVSEADRLLFAVGRQDEIDRAVKSATVGKILPDAFYLHVSALSTLPAVLRVYEGCAQVLVGAVPEATIVKLNRLERKVAYMAYPTFDRDPHPSLKTSLRVDLRKLDVRLRDFSDSSNPPILHRKETFVSEDYPGCGKFARLTGQEERAGLLGGPAIGTRDGWNELLDVEGYALQGHRLVARRSGTTA
jgi:DNA phosphorothioation-associated putative methyltransferase